MVVNRCLRWLAVLVLCSCVKADRSSIKLLSFNTGLTRTVPKYSNRVRPVIEALKDEKSDLVCLQEVWNGDDIYKIKKAVSSNYKYTYSGLHTKRGTIKKGPACVRSDLEYIGCATRNKCFEEYDYITCLIQKCDLFKWSKTCRTCALLSVRGFIEDCADSRTAKYNFNTNGLMLLSKRPLNGAKVTDYVSGVPQIAPRAKITASVKGIGYVVCTHLTVDLSKIYYEEKLPFSNWPQQNFAEVKDLVRSTRNKEKVVIMGTLNTGPNTNKGDIRREFPVSYKKLMTSGFKSGYVKKVGDCTRCTTNPFGANYYPYSTVTDHILTKGFKVKTAKRRFDDLIEGKDYPLSYLYGVEVTVVVV